MNQSDFWDYCLAVYAEDGIDKDCIDLQDQYGYDVILLLFVVWSGIRGIQIDSTLNTELVSIARHWQEHVVSPLRDVRRYLKTSDHEAEVQGPTERLRQQVKSLELESEKLEAAALVANSASIRFQPIPKEDAQQMSICLFNVKTYAQQADLAFKGEVKDTVERIVSASIKVAAQTPP